MGTTRAPEDSNHLTYRESKQEVTLRRLVESDAAAVTQPEARGTVNMPTMGRRWVGGGNGEFDAAMCVRRRRKRERNMVQCNANAEQSKSDLLLFKLF